MAEADIVVSSTGSPQTILHRDDVASVMAGRGSRPLFLIDIAVPRDIDAEVEQIDNVYLYNVDHLEAIMRENVRQREQELARCRTILGERTAALMARLMPAPETNYDPGVQPQPRWALGAVAACPG
jgi:glutamyl-tRNA reductase